MRVNIPLLITAESGGTAVVLSSSFDWFGFGGFFPFCLDKTFLKSNCIEITLRIHSIILKVHDSVASISAFIDVQIIIMKCIFLTSNIFEIITKSFIKVSN